MKLWLSALLCFCLHAAFAFPPDSTLNRSFRFGAMGDYGFIIPHRPHMKSLVKGHSPGFRIHVERQFNGQKEWHRLYGRPFLGVEYQWFDLGNPEQLGYSNALYTYLRLPLNKKRSTLSDLRLGVGLVHLSEQYSLTENGKNLAIGSQFNGAVILQYLKSLPLSRHLWLNAGIGITHFSNAAYQVPNLGMNLASVSLGVEWKTDDNREPEIEVFGEKQRNFFYISSAFGINENFPPEGPKYGAFNLGTEYNWGISERSSLQARADLFYSEAVHAAMNAEEKSANRGQAIQAGLAIGYALHFGEFLIRIQTGSYLVDQYKLNGNIYNRFGMQQNINEHLSLNLGIKTHFAKAQHFEFGCGWTL